MGAEWQASPSKDGDMEEGKEGEKGEKEEIQDQEDPKQEFIVVVMPTVWDTPGASSSQLSVAGLGSCLTKPGQRVNPLVPHLSWTCLTLGLCCTFQL